MSALTLVAGVGVSVGAAWLGLGLGVGAALAIVLVARGVGVEGEVAGAVAGEGGCAVANAMLRVEKGRASSRAGRCVACREFVAPKITSRWARMTMPVSKLSTLVGTAADISGADIGF